MNNILLRASTLSIQKLLIFGLIAASIYYLVLYDDGAGVSRSIAEVNQKIAEEEKKKTESERALKEVEAIRALVQQLHDNFTLISSQIPTEIQPAEILKTIDIMAGTSGVNIKTKEPRKAVKKDIVEELPIRVLAEGKFAELTLFLYNMMNTERISRVLSFTLVPANPRDRKNTNLILDAVFANYRFIGEAKDKSAAEGGEHK